VAQTFTRTRFTWLAYFLLAFYGYFLNIFGPITPYLKDSLNLTYTVSSLHFTAFAAGILAIGLGGHIAIQRLGRWRSLWLGAVGMSLSAAVLVIGTSPVVTIGASFLMGLVGSLILAVVPSALSDQFGEARAVALSEANVVSSLIATAAPLMVGWLVHLANSWQLALIIVAVAPVLLYAVFRRDHPQGESHTHATKPASPRRLPFAYWVFWVAIVLAVSVEFCMVFWSADYLEHSLGMIKVDAAQAVSLFLAAMIIGRLAGSILVKRMPAARIVIGSLLIASAGFVLYWKSTSVLAGLAGLFITGLGVASLYPMILSLAIGASEGNTVQAGARATLASGTAIFALPLLLGRLADGIGIQQAYGIVALLLVGIFVILLSYPLLVPKSASDFAE